MTHKVNSIAQARARLAEPWVHTVLGQVDDYCAYLCRFDGTYRFHQHTKDEMYLVLEGEAFVEFHGEERIPLQVGDSLVVKAGEMHRSGTGSYAMVLMFKARDLFAE